MASVFRSAVQADIGWLNAGDLRADLPHGDITKAKALAVNPFDNKIMKIGATGAELKQALEEGSNSFPDGNSGRYPLLAGATYNYTA